MALSRPPVRFGTGRFARCIRWPRQWILERRQGYRLLRLSLSRVVHHPQNKIASVQDVTNGWVLDHRSARCATGRAR
jgi:hypothetical protein